MVTIIEAKNLLDKDELKLQRSWQKILEWFGFGWTLKPISFPTTGRGTESPFPAGNLGNFGFPFGNFARRKAWVGTGDMGEGEGGGTCASFGPDLLSSRFRVDFWVEKLSKELCLSMGSPEVRSSVEIC